MQRRGQVGCRPTADDLQVSEGVQIGKVRVTPLNVEEAGDFFDRRKILQSRWVHLGMAIAELEILLKLLKSTERLIKDRKRTFDHGAVLQEVNVACVNRRGVKVTNLGTGAVARDALAVNVFLLRRTGSHTSAVVFQQVFGAVLYAGGAIREFAVGIFLPLVVFRIVALHRRTFLFAYSVVVKVLACDAVGLFGPRTAASAKQMTTFARFRSKTTSAVTLRRAVDLGELLAVVFSFAPTSGLAVLVTRRTTPLGLLELVDVKILRIRARYDFLPLDGLNVTQVVVVHDADGAFENICGEKKVGVSFV